MCIFAVSFLIKIDAILVCKILAQKSGRVNFLTNLKAACVLISIMFVFECTKVILKHQNTSQKKRSSFWVLRELTLTLFVFHFCKNENLRKLRARGKGVNWGNAEKKVCFFLGSLPLG